MSHYLYQCFTCGAEFSSEEIEENSHYLCPRCGQADKNQPLIGVLQVIYDYASLSKEIDTQAFKAHPAGQMWRYPQLWPLKRNDGNTDQIFACISNERLSGLDLPSNLLGRWTIDGKTVHYLDDTRNPTASYKDRASLLVALKALEMGLDNVVAASTGNAGSSLAGICARLGLSSHIFVPQAIPHGKLLQLLAYGAHVHLVEGDYDAAFDLCMDVARYRKWYSRNTALNPLTIEGKKSAAFDMYLLTAGKMPDCIVVPTGDGVIIAGIYKGLWDLLQLKLIPKLPRLISVQAEGSDAVVRYVRDGSFVYQSASTIADSISAGAPRNLFMAAAAVKQTNGHAIAVSDSSILDAQKRIARELGMLVEPAAATSLAGYLKMQGDGMISESETVLLLFTGHGLKDTRSLESWTEKITAKSPDQWKLHFGMN